MIRRLLCRWFNKHRWEPFELQDHSLCGQGQCHATVWYVGWICMVCGEYGYEASK